MTVDYSRYYCVVIPNCPADVKYPFRYAIQFDNPAYSTVESEYFFAVMGTIHNVWIEPKAGIDAVPKKYKVADKIEDAVVGVKSSFLTGGYSDKPPKREKRVGIYCRVSSKTRNKTTFA